MQKKTIVAQSNFVVNCHFVLMTSSFSMVTDEMKQLQDNLRTMKKSIIFEKQQLNDFQQQKVVLIAEIRA
jgi:hypothetical protein